MKYGIVTYLIPLDNDQRLIDEAPLEWDGAYVAADLYGTLTVDNLEPAMEIVFNAMKRKVASDGLPVKKGWPMEKKEVTV